MARSNLLVTKYFAHFPLGQVNDFWTSVIRDGYLLDASDWMMFEKTVNEIIWPSGIGRLPDNVGSEVLVPICTT
jgi:hypothetical protein